MKSMKVALVFMLLDILRLGSLSSQQPSDVSGPCQYGYSEDILECISKDLPSIPKFNQTQHFRRLELEKNKIDFIGANAFKHLVLLLELNLSENMIYTIEDGAFEGLSQLRDLDLRTNQLTVLGSGMFQGLPSLEALNLSRNNISFIEAGTFQGMTTLYILDLGYNKLTVLTAGIFQGLPSLYRLYVPANNIHSIEPATFDGLQRLGVLHLEGNNLSSLSVGCFNGLSSLWELHLNNNSMTTLVKGIFQDIKPRQIDLRFNQIEKIEPSSLRGLHPNLTFYSDDWKVCCVAVASGALCKTITTNTPIFLDVIFSSYALFAEISIFSSCEDLMHNVALRTFIWILGIFSVGFNLGVMSWRLLSRFRSRRQGPSRHQRKSTLLAVCLAFGDLCMGIFLLILATADQYYRGYYILQDDNWRSSSWCPLAGFLAAFSSEFSVFILTLITVDRYLAILYPSSNRVLNYFWTKIIVVCLVVFSIALATIPLMNSSFSDFYNQTGVCLALPFSVATSGATNTSALQESPSWIYSFSVFIALNTVSVLTIVFCYARIFWEAIKSNRGITNTRKNIESKMGGRIMLIVGTDMACWLPIIVLGFLSAFGCQLPSTVYAWIAVFVLPINSAINPLIYTFYTAAFRKAICTKCVKVTGSQRRYFKPGTRDQDSFRSSYRTRTEDTTEMQTCTQDSSNLS